ncbi:MAG: ClpXP protease specificity-enhancing factor SspB [Xanthobacteraceae bacterium]
MPEDHIRYDLLAQAALRGVVRTVLADAAKNGLPGEHHFKITFATAAPGVRLSERMRAQYPQAMTIVLQHQFWDLAVREEAFEVGLSFGGIAEKLIIPFDALTAFIDPSVQFGFQFESGEAARPGEAESAAQDKQPEKSAPAPLPAETKQAGALPPPPAAKEQQGPNRGGEVVSLDRFRKK